MCGQWGWGCQCFFKRQDLEGMVKFVLNVWAGGWMGMTMSVLCEGLGFTGNVEVSALYVGRS